MSYRVPLCLIKGNFLLEWKNASESYWQGHLRLHLRDTCIARMRFFWILPLLVALGRKGLFPDRQFHSRVPQARRLGLNFRLEFEFWSFSGCWMLELLSHGDSRSIFQDPSSCFVYRHRSCRRLGLPCQNSTRVGART